MPDAANSENSLEGYAAVNGLDDGDEIARRAHELWQERVRSGEEGTADGDWFRAESDARRLRSPGGAAATSTSQVRDAETKETVEEPVGTRR